MAQATRPGNPERGWNDPPMLLHTNPTGGVPVGVGNAVPKRTMLNKRVAHPGITDPVPAPSGSSTAQRPPPRDGPCDISGTSPVANIVLLPPTISTTISKGIAPIIIPNMTAVPGVPSPGSPEDSAFDPLSAGTPRDDLEIPDVSDDQQLLHYIDSRLLRVLSDCENVLGTRVTEDVKKKLKIFESMWENGKISYPVKAAMARLATALHKRKCDIAHEIHLGLMMDYVSEVGQWMVGIKRLIQEARHVDPPLSPGSTGELNKAPTLISANSSSPQGIDSQTGLDSANTQDDSALADVKGTGTCDPQVSHSITDQELVAEQPALNDIHTSVSNVDSAISKDVTEPVIQDLNVCEVIEPSEEETSENKPVISCNADEINGSDSATVLDKDCDDGSQNSEVVDSEGNFSKQDDIDTTKPESGQATEEKLTPSDQNQVSSADPCDVAESEQMTPPEEITECTDNENKDHKPATSEETKIQNPHLQNTDQPES